MNTIKSDLTPQEQIRLVNGYSFFRTAPIPEKDIPWLQLLDGGTGINFEQLFGDFLSSEGLPGIGGQPLRNVLKYFYTPEKLPDEQSKALYDWICRKLRERIPSMTPPGCYPPGILLGAAWDPEVVCAVGRALGQEARAYGVNVLLGTPNVNLHRDIRNGRLFEGYSEDPCLVSKLAPALVQGVQSQGVAANVKHFAANHQETNRMNINEHIPERALHELYYPGFRACVKAGVCTVMSAYNQINNVPCTQNRALLHDLLREKWGFEGVVMSDWGAVYHPAEAVNAGNDLAMPGPIPPEQLTAALEKGQLSPDALEISAERIAHLAKEFAKPASGEISLKDTDRAAYHAAAEAIVLLKNDKHALPLPASSVLTVYGTHADSLLTCGEGSAGILTTRNVSLRTALEKRFKQVLVNETSGLEDTFIYVYSLEGREGHDRKNISLPDSTCAELERLLCDAEKRSMKKILILNVSAPVALGDYNERFDAVLCVFLPGMQGAQALADILCGQVNPSGRLPLTWPRRLEDMPSYLNFPGDGMEVYYGEGIFVGYRWYDARNIEPLYPFGHGLSYTGFAIRQMKADCETFCDSVTVSVDIANTGTQCGKTVVQLYVSDPCSTLTKPIRELKDFRKIFLAPGETKTIAFTLTRHDFESYDPNLHMWTMEEGIYRIEAGLSSRDIQAECSVYADTVSPYSYGPDTSVKVIMEQRELRKTAEEFFAEKGLPWTAMLTSYEYTAQDTICQILSQTECRESDCRELYQKLLQIKKK